MLTSLRIGLVVWAVVGPLLARAVMRGREVIMVAAAINATQIKDRAGCDIRVAQVARAGDAAIDEAVDEAVAAADALSVTPEVPAELRLLCEHSASCRSRGKP